MTEKKRRKLLSLSVFTALILFAILLFGEITGFAADSSMILKRNIEQNLSGAFSSYNRNGADGTESMLLLNEQWAYCMEPATELNNLTANGTRFYLQENGNGVKWLQDRYGWSFDKINNLTKAVCYAKSYFGSDWVCNYVLTQNLIWSEIKDHEDYNQASRYMLTNTKKYTCAHLDSKAKVDQAIAEVWKKVSTYNTIPSYTGQTISADAGEKIWIVDKNNISDQIEFVNLPAGVQVAPAKGGLTVTTNASFAGKSITLNYRKKGLPTGGGVYIYAEGSRQKVALWNNVINPVSGSVRIVFKRTEYLQASYHARDQVAQSFDIHIEKTDADTGEVLAGAEFEIYKDGEKMATVKTDETGRASYHWRGNILYTNYFSSTKKVLDFGSWGTAYQSAKDEVIGKVKIAVEQLKSQTAYTWKVVEMKAPDGYELNPESWEQTFNLNTHAIEVQFSNTAPGSLKLQKISENAELVKDNVCYTLEGAEYGIYASQEDALADQNRIDILRTDADGNTNIVTLHAGTYYIKEITASAGYLLCDENDGETVMDGIHRAVVTPKETTQIVCTEVPGTHTFPLTLKKMDQELSEPFAVRGNMSLQGAVFELSYYMNVNGKTEDTPYHRWYFYTDADGKIAIGDSSCFLKNVYTMQDGTTLKSDELYTDADGQIFYPLGSYVLKEVVPPRYFQLKGFMCFSENADKKASVTDGLKMLIKQRANGAEAELYGSNDQKFEKLETENITVNAYDSPRKGSICLYKKDSKGFKHPLEGVIFEMKGVQTGDVYTGTTDAEGRIEWKDLIPQTYRITEIKTKEGYHLLKEEIEVTLPLEKSLEEWEKSDADLSKAVYDEVTKMYGFYDLTYHIDNAAEFSMPVTGGSGKMPCVFLIIGMAAAGTGIFLFYQKRRERKWNLN